MAFHSKLSVHTFRPPCTYYGLCSSSLKSQASFTDPMCLRMALAWLSLGGPLAQLYNNSLAALHFHQQGCSKQTFLCQCCSSRYQLHHPCWWCSTLDGAWGEASCPGRRAAIQRTQGSLPLYLPTKDQGIMVTDARGFTFTVKFPNQVNFRSKRPLTDHCCFREKWEEAGNCLHICRDGREKVFKLEVRSKWLHFIWNLTVNSNGDQKSHKQDQAHGASSRWIRRSHCYNRSVSDVSLYAALTTLIEIVQFQKRHVFIYIIYILLT